MDRARLAQWTFTWYLAAELAARRASSEGVGRAAIPLLLFVDAMRNVIRGAERILGGEHAALRNFRGEVPDAVNVRDVIGHFDDYALGSGNLQKSGLVPLELNHFVSGSINNDVRRIHIAEFEIELPSALDALGRLASAALDAASITPVSGESDS